MMRLLYLVSVLLLPLNASAEEDKAAAAACLNAGLQLYDAGQYRESIVAFEQCYTSTRKPTFLFNIALAYRKLAFAARSADDAHTAVRYFRRYLRRHQTEEHRPASDQANVETYILALENSFGPVQEGQSPPVPSPEAISVARLPSETRPPQSATTASSQFTPRARVAIALVGVGLAGCAAGATLLGVGFAHSDGDTGGTLDDYSHSRSTLDAERVAGIASAAVGGAVLVTGLTLLLAPRSSEPKTTGWWIAPATRGLAAGGTF